MAPDLVMVRLQTASYRSSPCLYFPSRLIHLYHLAQAMYRRESCEEEVKPVELAPVEIYEDPPGHVVHGRDLHHNAHEKATYVVPQ